MSQFLAGVAVMALGLLVKMAYDLGGIKKELAAMGAEMKNRVTHEECALILAKRQPAASDLRMVLVVSKTVRDLERIGDEAKKIAKMAVKLTEEGEAPRGYFEIRHISESALEMVQDTLNALARLDTNQALLVVKRDKELDRNYKSAVREIIT